MLYCNTVTVAATRRAGAGLGSRALGRACRRAGGRRRWRWGAQAWALGHVGVGAGARRRTQALALGRASVGAGARRRGRWGAGAAGARALGRQARGRVLAGGRAAGRRNGRAGRAGGARGVGERPRRACACRLGVLAGQLGQVGALCTWLSFDSVFDPIRLGIFLSQ